MTDTCPLVSVGIFTYNRPQGLLRTLTCITGQTYKNLEIIVSDNCSPGEETEKIVRHFSENDPRIKYYRQKANIGMTNNSNFVLEQATGEFFMWAADDDEWYPEYIEKCVSVLLQDESIILCTSLGVIVSDSTLSQITKIGNTTKRTPYWLCNEDVHTYGMPPLKRVKKYILNSGTNLCAYCIYRTKILKKWVFFSSHNPYKFGADRFFMARMQLLGPVYQIQEPLFVYHHGCGASLNPLSMKNKISVWEYYGLRVYPFLTAYINMIIDSLSWPVSPIDHVRIIMYYLTRMIKAKVSRYTSKNPFIGIPLYNYQPPRYHS